MQLVAIVTVLALVQYFVLGLRVGQARLGGLVGALMQLVR